MLKINSRSGVGVLDMVTGAAALIFIIFPVFSFATEKFMLINIAQSIKDSVDITNIAAYNSIITGNLSRVRVEFNSDEAGEIYEHLLSENLRLNPDLTPAAGSVADGKVTIQSLILYDQGFPCMCPNGLEVDKPTIHSLVCVPVKPCLYRQMIFEITGREYLDLAVHVDSEIPIDN